MYKQTILFIILFISAFHSYSQVSINDDGSDPEGSAMLEVKSTTGGFLPPRMTTTQISAIASPAEGLMVYNTSIQAPVYYDGTMWRTFYRTFGDSCGTVNYEGQLYHTVVIGTQCWMQENLNVGLAILGSQSQTDNGINEKYCYNDNSANCDVYGGLYQWDEMMQYVTTEGAQGICPPGWHIPSVPEWNILIDYLGGSSVAGGKMKEEGTAHWQPINAYATNESGFTALPGGYKDSNGFGGLNTDGYFLSSTESTATNVYLAWLLYFTSGASININSKSTAFSVRCVKD